MELIDIHSHYAWDIDDGIANLDDAKKALTKAKNQNIKELSQHHILFQEQQMILI